MYIYKRYGKTLESKNFDHRLHNIKFLNLKKVQVQTDIVKDLTDLAAELLASDLRTDQFTETDYMR